MNTPNTPLCGIKKIEPELGDFVILKDYGSEGITVWGQSPTLTEAIHDITSTDCGGPFAVLKLVRIEPSVTEV